MEKYWNEMGKNILSEYGFESLGDFISHILAFQNMFVLKIQLLISILAITFLDLLGIIDTYVWSPALGLLTISGLIIVRAITGAAVKMINDKQKFHLNKSLKTIPILLAHIAIMSGSWHIGNADGVMAWLPSVVFAVFATYHFLLLFKDFVNLGLIEGELLTKIADKIAKRAE
jgi:hypothetical protein